MWIMVFKCLVQLSHCTVLHSQQFEVQESGFYWISWRNNYVGSIKFSSVIDYYQRILTLTSNNINNTSDWFHM